MLYRWLIIFALLIAGKASHTWSTSTKESVGIEKLSPLTAVWALKDGTEVTIRPLSGDEADRQRIYKILKDADTQRFTRDGKPWPDTSVEGTYRAYVTYWKTLKDFLRLGIKPHKISLCFIVVGPKGDIIGMTGIQRSKRDETRHEVYYSLMPSYRQQGLGTKMGRFVMDFYKKLYGNKVIEAAVLPDNKASIALLKKLGFVPKLNAQGKPEFVISHNRRQDIYHYIPSSKQPS